MQTKTVNQNLTQLTRLRFVNCFLLREDDGLTLIDTTVGGSADSILGAARGAGAPIRRIALTHGHGDHVGSLDALKGQLGDDVEVLMPELDAGIHAGETFTDGKPPGSWPKLSTAPDVRLGPGDRVGSLEVVSSPGHTPGHVSFLDTRDRTLIAGDAYTSMGRVAVPAEYYIRFPLATMATWDKAKAIESARSLRALDPALLVVGHGPPTPSPGPAMEQAIAHVS